MNWTISDELLRNTWLSKCPPRAGYEFQYVVLVVYWEAVSAFSLLGSDIWLEAGDES